jgi:2-amino-4-hydroxy-6-hydroxymethyldihydropteridine diphosphokinase
MAVVYLALGANLGDRRANLVEALHRLEPELHIDAVSALYESAPQPPSLGPDYYNTACRATTELEPLELLDYVKEIERAMGRVDTGHWGPRPIDIDIALYDDLVFEDERLVIPHPRLAERNFVLQPLLDLNRALMHPVTGEAMSAMLARVGDDGLTRVETDWAGGDTGRG